MAIRQGVHTHIALGIFLICSGGLCGITLVGLLLERGIFGVLASIALQLDSAVLSICDSDKYRPIIDYKSTCPTR